MKLRNVIIGAIGGVVTATATIYATADHFFKLAVVRPDKAKKKQNIHRIVKSQTDSNDQFEMFSDTINEGKEWLKTQKLETLYTKSFDGLTLAAELLPCENAKGTIISVHGFGGSIYRDLGAVAKHFHDSGYRVLLVNQRAHGKSEGQYITYGVNERKDIVEWAGLVERRFGKNQAIFLHGVSMGATSVLMASGNRDLPESVRGIIADSAFISPYRLIENIVDRDMHVPKFPFLYAMEAICKEKAGFGFSDYSTLEALDDNTRPILFIHGEDDALVPVDMTEENYRACTTEKRIVVVDGAKHGLAYLVDPDRVEREVDDFLNEYRIR